MKENFYADSFGKQNIMFYLYLVITGGFLIFRDAPMVAWLVYWSTLFIFYCLNEVSDAIYYSVSTRINLQSAWLDVRLQNIERKLGEVSGQEEWLNHVKNLNEATGGDVLNSLHFHHIYPEKY
jgi:hypothetical protein